MICHVVVQTGGNRTRAYVGIRNADSLAACDKYAWESVIESKTNN